MKITLEIPDTHIDNALTDVHCRYWATELEWNTETRTGFVIERGETEVRHEITLEKIEKAIHLMREVSPHRLHEVLNGKTDGPCRDVFLQYIVFGRAAY